MSLPLREVFAKFGKALPGIKCRWDDEYVGYESTMSYIGNTYGALGSDRFIYDYPRGPNKLILDRHYEWIDEEEKFISARIQRTLHGPRVVIHSRFHE